MSRPGWRRAERTNKGRKRIQGQVAEGKLSRRGRKEENKADERRSVLLKRRQKRDKRQEREGAESEERSENKELNKRKREREGPSRGKMKLGNISRRPLSIIILWALNKTEKELFHRGYHDHHAQNRNQGHSSVRGWKGGWRRVIKEDEVSRRGEGERQQV